MASETVPRSQTVELRSHPRPPHVNPPQIVVTDAGDGYHAAVTFEAYWTHIRIALDPTELAALRDAIDAVLTSEPATAATENT